MPCASPTCATAGSGSRRLACFTGWKCSRTSGQARSHRPEWRARHVCLISTAGPNCADELTNTAQRRHISTAVPLPCQSRRQFVAGLPDQPRATRDADAYACTNAGAAYATECRTTTWDEARARPLLRSSMTSLPAILVCGFGHLRRTPLDIASAYIDVHAAHSCIVMTVVNAGPAFPDRKIDSRTDRRTFPPPGRRGRTRQVRPGNPNLRIPHHPRPVIDEPCCLATPPRLLVFGASGYVGTNLVPALLAAGAGRVRAAARNRKVLEAQPWEGVELVEADALKPDTLAAALADVDVAYYLVHSMAAGKDFGRLDLEAAGNFARAAEAAGVGAHRLPRRPRAARRRFRAPRFAQGNGRPAARIRGARHRNSRGHHRRAGLRGVRSDARPRLPPAGDGDAQVGAVEVVADRAVEPARLPAEGGDAARSRRTGLRRGRARVPVVRGDDAAVRRGRRQAAAHPARARAVAEAVVVLARPRHRRAREHRARADRRAEARHSRE